MGGIDYIVTLDRFLIRPGHISTSLRYEILDFKGDPIVFAEQLTNPFWRAIKFAACVVAGGAAFLVAEMVLPGEISYPIRFSIQLGAFVVAMVPTFLLLSVRYRTALYRDESRRDLYLEIIQENRIPFPSSWYTVKDEKGSTLGRMKRSSYHRLFFTRWYLFGKDELIKSIAEENSVVRSVLRRAIGTPVAPLKTNYTLFDGRMGNILGELNRRRPVFDCYVLDLDSDYRKTIDRRLALAFGVMIDAGEKA